MDAAGRVSTGGTGGGAPGVGTVSAEGGGTGAGPGGEAGGFWPPAHAVRINTRPKAASLRTGVEAQRFTSASRISFRYTSEGDGGGAAAASLLANRLKGTMIRK